MMSSRSWISLLPVCKIWQASVHQEQSISSALENLTSHEKLEATIWTDKKVFVHELILNANNAIEKLRYLHLTTSDNEIAQATGDRSLEIHIDIDKQNRILTIQDTGVGMTREELIANLGNIHIVQCDSQTSTIELAYYIFLFL